MRISEIMAKIETDRQKKGRVIGRVTRDVLGRDGKIVFFGRRQPRLGERVVLQEFEDKGKFIDCRHWRYEQCVVYMFSRETDFSLYKNYREIYSVEPSVKRDQFFLNSYVVEGIEEISERFFQCLRDPEYSYILCCESTELAQRLEPTVESSEIFIERGKAICRTFKARQAPYGEFIDWIVGTKEFLWLDESGYPAPKPSGGKRKLTDSQEENIRDYIEVNWPIFEPLLGNSGDEEGLLYFYDSDHWIWVRHKYSGGIQSNWRIAYLFKAKSRDAAIEFIQSWGKHHELAVLTTMPWVP